MTTADDLFRESQNGLWPFWLKTSKFLLFGWVNSLVSQKPLWVCILFGLLVSPWCELAFSRCELVGRRFVGVIVCYACGECLQLS